MSRIKIIKTKELENCNDLDHDKRTEFLKKRTELHKDEYDKGLTRDWYNCRRYIVIEKNQRRPIAILGRDGPQNSIGLWWWIDRDFRKKGYMSEAIVQWSDILRSERVTGISDIIRNDSEDQEACEVLIKKMRKLFE